MKKILLSAVLMMVLLMFVGCQHNTDMLSEETYDSSFVPAEAEETTKEEPTVQNVLTASFDNMEVTYCHEEYDTYVKDFVAILSFGEEYNIDDIGCRAMAVMFIMDKLDVTDYDLIIGAKDLLSNIIFEDGEVTSVTGLSSDVWQDMMKNADYDRVIEEMKNITAQWGQTDEGVASTTTTTTEAETTTEEITTVPEEPTDSTALLATFDDMTIGYSPNANMVIITPTGEYNAYSAGRRTMAMMLLMKHLNINDYTLEIITRGVPFFVDIAFVDGEIASSTGIPSDIIEGMSADTDLVAEDMQSILEQWTQSGYLVPMLISEEENAIAEDITEHLKSKNIFPEGHAIVHVSSGSAFVDTGEIAIKTQIYIILDGVYNLEDAEKISVGFYIAMMMYFVEDNMDRYDLYVGVGRDYTFLNGELIED